MTTVKQLIKECRASATNDDIFVDRIQELVAAKGEIVCQAVFDIYANINLNPSIARKDWDRLLIHREQMAKLLGRPINLVSVMCDFLSTQGNSLSEPKIVEMASYDNIARNSTHDDLTGLYNRQYFSESLEQHLALAVRNQNELSILFLDADDFKDINDTYGHATGDSVLREISRVILDEIRQSDVAARYGGEEFVILMPMTNSIEALILADRIREKIAQTSFVVAGSKPSITVSGGIASFPVNAHKADDLINLADSALYRAKGAGKNNISLFKQDKRRFLRIDLHEKVQIKELGFNKLVSFTGISKDICVGGILFENNAPIEIGTKVQISVPIGSDEPVLLIGTVVRLEALAPDKYDIGVVIAFKEMDKLVKNEISRFLVSQAQKSV